MIDFLLLAWPGGAALAFLLTYELAALWTQRPWRDGGRRLPTLTLMGKRAARRYPWLPWVIVPLVIYVFMFHMWGCIAFSICY